jgi:hypothetical protein
MTQEAERKPLPASTSCEPIPTREQRAAALVNPASGLANDYLNLFNEIVMLIEQLPAMPELIDDILRWQPVGYQEYFAASALPGRASALDAYASLDEKFRRNFEAIVSDLDHRAVGAVAAIRLNYRANGETQTEAMTALCERAGENMREVLRKATNLVNYGKSRAKETAQQRANRLLQTSDIRKAI